MQWSCTNGIPYWPVHPIPWQYETLIHRYGLIWHWFPVDLASIRLHFQFLNPCQRRKFCALLQSSDNFTLPTLHSSMTNYFDNEWLNNNTKVRSSNSAFMSCTTYCNFVRKVYLPTWIEFDYFIGVFSFFRKVCQSTYTQVGKYHPIGSWQWIWISNNENVLFLFWISLFYNFMSSVRMFDTYLLLYFLITN